jgi:phosphatidylserine decarboxylase
VDLSEVETPPGGFTSFDEFFTRRLVVGARPVASDPDVLVSPSDGRWAPRATSTVAAAAHVVP